MAFRYSRPAMTGAAIFTLAGVTVLPLAQANAAPASPQDEARSGATQGQPNSAAQNGQDQGQQQSANANGQGQQGANASGQNQDGATQGQQQSANGQGRQQGANADAQGQQGANASDQSQNGATQGGAAQDPSQAASGGEQQQGQPSAPVESIFVVIDSVDGFIDSQKTDNALNVRGVWYDNNPSFNYSLTVQELDEFGNVVDDDVSTTVGGSSISSDGHFDLHVNVDGTKINPSHKYQVHLTAYDQGDMTTSEASYPVTVWKHSYILPVVPLSAAR